MIAARLFGVAVYASRYLPSGWTPQPHLDGWLMTWAQVAQLRRLFPAPCKLGVCEVLGDGVSNMQSAAGDGTHDQRNDEAI